MTDSVIKKMISEEAEKEKMTGNEVVKFAMAEFGEWLVDWYEKFPSDEKPIIELVEIYIKEK